MSKNITNEEYKELMRIWDANFPDDTQQDRQDRFRDYMEQDDTVAQVEQQEQEQHSDILDSGSAEQEA
jgi:hypothetical protein